MKYAMIVDESPVELSSTDWWVDTDGITHSPRAFDLWTEEELADKDVYPIQEGIIPAGHRVISSSLQLVDGVINRVLVTEPVPEPTEVEVANSVRSQRDDLLRQSDWTQVLDAPVDQVAWAAYRQALRDIPQTEGFPFVVEWPVIP